MPHYARREGNRVLLYSTNPRNADRQQLLKPVEESWSFDKAGTATLLGTMPYGEIFDRSKAEGDVNGGDKVSDLFFIISHSLYPCAYPVPSVPHYSPVCWCWCC